jgi:hypothetical protein
MSNNLAQQLTHINENNYDDEITATVQPHEFIAVTSNLLDPPDAAQRNITVQIMTLDGVDTPTTAHTNTNLFVRGENETSVKAVLLDTNGKEVDSNVTNY